ncbi:MAG: beta-ketoacyl synthase N-terminal-like domain-containing protein [Arcobacteraceae bacterium]
MKKRVFITGSSIICALGNHKETSVEKIKQINNENYPHYLKENFEKINFYRIKKFFTTQEEKFYWVLKNSILDAINDAKLTEQEAKELHVFLGSTSMSISIKEEEFGESNKISSLGYGEIGNFIEELIASNYPSTIIQTACTSSANALTQAAELIKYNKIKRALIVGFEFFNHTTYRGFQSLLLLSPTGTYKPFDKNSDGLILGEGCSSLILDSEKKETSDFELLSSHTCFDNFSVTSSNPNGELTLFCMEKALDKANLSLKNLTCIKAHATGSENSNLSEVTAINSLFKKYNQKTDVVILKPYIGHTLGACGTNEIVLLCESIKHNFLPKTINFKEKYDSVDFTPLLESKMLKKATILFQFIGFGGSITSLILSNES